MEIGSRYKVKCIGVNNYAKGITKIDSLLCFVDNLYKDEEALIEITTLKKNLAFGKVVEYIKKSPYRIDSICNHNDLSSCPFSNIAYDAELNIKKEMILSNINRVLNNPIENLEIVSGDIIDGYRNKVTLFFKKVTNKILVGNFSEESNEFNEIISCVQIKPLFLDLAKKIADLLDKYNIEIIDYINKTGLVKGVSFRRSEYNNKISIVILSRFDDSRFNDLTEELYKIDSNITGIEVAINDSFDTFLYSNNNHTYYGEPYIEEKFNDIIIKASNQSFMQVNTSCASKLYKEACDIIPLSKNDIVVDLYSGCGGIGLTLANRVKKVYSIETVKSAVKLARINALINKVDNIDFYCMDALRFDEVIKNKKVKALFVDPPRAGLDKRVIDKILSLDIEYIIYISCDSYTQARDISLLNGKYTLKYIKAFNMFPRTKHVETIVNLYKKL